MDIREKISNHYDEILEIYGSEDAAHDAIVYMLERPSIIRSNTICNKNVVEKCKKYIESQSSSIIDDDDDLVISLSSEYAKRIPANPMKDLYTSQLGELLPPILNTLREREAKVLELRFGLDGSECSLREIAKEFLISPARIRQIEAKALRKLRFPSRSKKIKYIYSLLLYNIDLISEDSTCKTAINSSSSAKLLSNYTSSKDKFHRETIEDIINKAQSYLDICKSNKRFTKEMDEILRNAINGTLTISTENLPEIYLDRDTINPNIAWDAIIGLDKYFDTILVRDSYFSKRITLVRNMDRLIKATPNYKIMYFDIERAKKAISLYKEYMIQKYTNIDKMLGPTLDFEKSLNDIGIKTAYVTIGMGNAYTGYRTLDIRLDVVDFILRPKYIFSLLVEMYNKNIDTANENAVMNAISQIFALYADIITTLAMITYTDVFYELMENPKHENVYIYLLIKHNRAKINKIYKRLSDNKFDTIKCVNDLLELNFD